MTRPMTAQRDPRAQRKPSQSRARVDAVAIAEAAVKALVAERDGMPEDYVLRCLSWPERGRMTREQIAQEGLRVARFFDAPVFGDLVPSRGFLLDLCSAGVPWQVFVKAERQRTWRTPGREGEPISQSDVAAFFAEHLERDGGRGLTVAAVNTHFGYPPPQTEKAGGRERTGQIGLGL